MKVCVVIPAFRTAAHVGAVVRAAKAHAPVVVVDDGSDDDTAKVAEEAGATVARHETNRGKGAATLTGLAKAAEMGFEVAATMDSDGQHDAQDLPRLLEVEDPRALVLGVRDLAGAGAPRANRISNGISNFFISAFAWQRLPDTQCGMRRYPVARTLGLRLRGTGYEMEAEVILKAKRAGWPIVSVPIRVRYPEGRKTHFRIGRDVPRIIGRVLRTMIIER